MPILPVRTLLLRSMATAFAAIACCASVPADAAERKTQPPVEQAGPAAHPKSPTYRRAPEVRGFVQRRGGYSYSSSDTVNTTGPGRGLYGSTNSYRFLGADRQTRSGPFDHGFFYDGGGTAPRGGDSPYIN
jgi:hypothetical protein